MEYYKLLQLEREPFSNSPDPDYFFQSEQHLGCLQKLELALRLKRGLNVVIGDVGTGKTTLCRQLIRTFTDDDGVESHLILDPSFDQPLTFLRMMDQLFHGRSPDDRLTEGELKESIKQSLFSKGVDQNKTIVLIIDEGQKISESCVEILRELLNYETNTFKLLQIVIFAQLEFEQVMKAHANFADRINLLHHLAPMNFKDTRKMVQHRIKLSSSDPRPKQLFTLPAMWAIYRASRGYPRKIIHLCHQSMLAMIIQNRTRAGWAIILSCKRRLAVSTGGNRRALLISAGVVLVIALALIAAPPAFLSKDSQEASLRTPPVKTPPEEDRAAPPPEPMAMASNTDPAQTTGEAPEREPHEPFSAPPNAQGSVLAHPDALDPEAAVPMGDGGPASPAFEKDPEDLPPEILGQIIIQPGDTLVELAHAVYGSYQYNRLKAVIAANPHIQNPNNITIGQIVMFPSLPHKFDFKDTASYWVILNESRSLPSAMQQLREISDAMAVPLQVIPHWHPHSGLRFYLAIKGYFSNEQAARNYTRALPEAIMKDGRVISRWPEQTRYYADPRQGGMLNSHIIDVRQ